MSTQEKTFYAEILTRIENGKNLPYAERQATVELCEKALETTGFRRMWSQLLIRAFKIAYGGI